MNVVNIPVSLIDRNPWNPNEQTPRQNEAIRESMTTYGFVMPIVVRPDPSSPGRYQIIDGEHRWEPISQLVPGQGGAIDDLVSNQEIPCVVIDVDDAAAKKLTIILNETRGEADIAKLSDLLSELSDQMDIEDLLIGLPYSSQELSDMIDIGAFDWSSGNPDHTGEQNDTDSTVSFRLTEEERSLWDTFSQGNDLPKTPRGNGQGLVMLLKERNG